ncbi:ABC transporter ATP-binding protein [Streptomyces canus]|uniref:ABC transporter ATP-binding protein n=1 Tax=Streptomyces canus TaxID=58343 RepID=UPI0037238C29
MTATGQGAPPAGIGHAAGGAGARVRLEGAERTYPGAVPVRALHATDLDVDPGQYTAIVGPSGSGKSTLLNLIGLMDRPSAGRLLLDGADTTAMGERERTSLRGRRIGFVFQAFHLLPHRSVLENVALAQTYTTRDRRRRREQAVWAIARVGLTHRQHALPSTLSGGERQRVAIARALAGNPGLLLCDEPTGNLDTATATHVLDLLEALNRDGTTLVVITHDPAVAERAHRRVTIRDGHLTTTPPATTGSSR